MSWGTRKASLMLAAAAVGVFITQVAHAGDTLFLKRATLDTTRVNVTALVDQSRADNSGKFKYHVVQFVSRVTPADLQNLRTLGVQTIYYIPDDAFLVRADAKKAKLIAMSSNNIRVVLPYMAEWKLSPEITPSLMTASDRDQFLVRLVSADDLKVVSERVRALTSVKVEAASDRSMIIEASVSDVSAITKLEGVEWIQPYAPMQLQHIQLDEAAGRSDFQTMAGDYSDLTGYESGTKIMKFDVPWSRGLKGAGQIGAMADTGLDNGVVETVHTDFRTRIPEGYIFGMFATSWEDPMGHGTHVSGSVTGNGSASGGKILGGAPQAKLLPGSMWSPMLSNLTVPPKLSDLFIKAYDGGARIHTNSWGSPRNFGAYDGFAQQVDEFAFQHQDFLILFAAGNSGVDANGDGRIDDGSVGSPGTAKNTLTVGASKNLVLVGGLQAKMGQLKSAPGKWDKEPIASSMLSETESGLAAFSSRGPTSDGRIKPEVVAPGTNVLSVRSQNPNAEPLWGEYNKDYVWSGGTSMSTPLVAGGALLVREYLIKQKAMPSPSAAMIKAILMNTAFDLYPGQFGAVGRAGGQELLTKRPTTDAGWGRVDLEKATDLALAVLVDERAGVGAGEIHKYPIRVSRDGKLSATLVYTDAPAAASAAKALVNDIDFELVRSNGVSVAAPRDRVNNSELIEIQVPAGDYELQVKGVNVPQGINGKQPYAAVVSIY